MKRTMKRSAAFFSMLLLLSGACAGEDLQLQLVPPEGCETSCGSMDCFNRLELRLAGPGDDDRTTCIKLAPQERSLCTMDLSSMASLPWEEAEYAVVTGSHAYADADGCAGPPLFYGEAPLADTGAISLKTNCLLNCAERKTLAFELQIKDFISQEVLSPEGFIVEVGILYDRRGEANLVDVVAFAPFSIVSSVDEASAVALSVDTFTLPNGDSACLAARVAARESGTSVTACLLPSEANQTIYWLSPEYRSRLSCSSEGCFVGRLQMRDGTPIGGATLALDAPQSVTINYGVDRVLQPLGQTASATQDHGLFVIEGVFVGALTASNTANPLNVLQNVGAPPASLSLGNIVVE